MHSVKIWCNVVTLTSQGMALHWHNTSHENINPVCNSLLSSWWVLSVFIFGVFGNIIDCLTNQYQYKTLATIRYPKNTNAEWLNGMYLETLLLSRILSHTYMLWTLGITHLSRISSQSLWHTERSTVIYCGGMCIMHVGYTFERFCSNTVSV